MTQQQGDLAETISPLTEESLGVLVISSPLLQVKSQLIETGKVSVGSLGIVGRSKEERRVVTPDEKNAMRERYLRRFLLRHKRCTTFLFFSEA